MQKKLSVVIVSYNSFDTILEAILPLYSLYQQHYLDVVVVDNHGKDGVQDLLSKHCDWVTFIPMEGNSGFGYGCNKGSKIKHSEYILFLNPDAVIESSSIELLVKFLDQNPKIAITAPAIKEGDELQVAGVMPLPVIGSKKYKKSYSGVKVIKPEEQPFQTTWLCGAIFLVRSSVFHQVGGFDEKFFLYFEETDLCKRTSDAGYEIWANGMSTAEHIGGGSSKDTAEQYIAGCISEHYFKSRYYFLKKHYGVFSAFTFEIYDLTHLITRTLKNILRRRKDPYNDLATRLKAPFFTEPG